MCPTSSDSCVPVRANFNLASDEEASQYHLAYVDEGTKQFIQQTWYCTSWPIVAAISESFDHLTAQCPGGNKFVVIESNPNLTHKNPANVIDLTVSWDFMRMHNLPADGKYYLFYIQELIPLDELVIGTTLPLKQACDSFCNLLNTAKFSLIRQNDYVFDHKQLVSLSTSPVVQGCFQIGTTKTSFVEIDAKDLNKLLAPKISSLLPNVLVSSSKSALKSHEFKIHLLAKQPHPHFNYESTIFLSKSTCLRLRIKSNEWFNAKITTSSATSSSDHWRPVQVQISSAEQGDDSVALSPVLFHNLLNLTDSSLARGKLAKSLFVIDTSNVLPIEVSKLTDDHFLRSIHVTLIPSPDYPGTIEVSNLLKNYFSRPRIVMKGDVICIHSLTWPSVNNEISSLKFPIIYFKVTKLEGTGLFVMRDQTNLYHTGNVHSLVPPMDESYFSSDQVMGSSCARIPSRRHSLNSFQDLLEPYLSGQLSSPVVLSLLGTGNATIVTQVAKETHRQVYHVDFNSILMDTPSATEARLRQALVKIAVYSPCITIFENFDLLCMEERGNDERYVEVIQETLKTVATQAAPFAVICVALLDNDKVLTSNPSYGMLFMHQVTLPQLSNEERKDFLINVTSDLHIHPAVNWEEVVRSTNGFTLEQLAELVSKSLYNRSTRLAKYHLPCHSLAGLSLLPQDMSSALHEMSLKSKKLIGAPEIPKVKWSDIGGLDHVKDEIMDMIQLPLECPELFAKSGLKRGGILLHGPPGTGKTLIAKAVATECAINFLSVKGPELINMYIGQSEENVRNIFANARANAPCVVFFDELDSLAPNRGQSGDSGGVMDRVVSQLLSEMDGVAKSSGVFLIGATNRVDLIDPAMLRPGRFDKVIYVGIPQEPAGRIQVLKALTRKFSSANSLDYELIESLCPKNYSGADFYSLCSTAMKNALKRAVNSIEDGLIDEKDADVNVTMDDFLQLLDHSGGQFSSLKSQNEPVNDSVSNEQVDN